MTTAQFGSLTAKKDKVFDTKNIAYIHKPDKQMRFNNASDPIHYVFNVLENRPLPVLAKEFVKDSLFDVTNFVSKIVR
jgi:hypothetical protein